MLRADRERATALGDPMASLCVLATVGDGEPEARTLVLRDLRSAQGEPILGVFMNRTSPKCAQLGQSACVAAVVYLPSLSVQYRLRCTLKELPADLVRSSWLLRPPIPKRMDWLYEERPQSTVPREPRRARQAA